MSGWIVGYLVGAAVVAVVVVVLLLLVREARRSAAAAEAVLGALHDTDRGAKGLWSLSRGHEAAQRAARAAGEPGPVGR